MHIPPKVLIIYKGCFKHTAKGHVDFYLRTDYNNSMDLGLHISPEPTKEEQTLQRALHDLLLQTPKNEYGFPLGIYRPDLLPLHDYQPEADAVSSLFNPTGDPLRASSVDPRLLRSNGRDHAEGGGSPFQPSSNDRIAEAEDGDNILEDVFEEAELQTVREVAPIATKQRLAGFLRSQLLAAYIPLQYEEGYPTLGDGRPIWDRLDYEPNDAFTCFQAFLQMPHVHEGTRLLGDLPEIMVNNQLLSLNGYKIESFPAKFRVFSAIYYWGFRAKAYDLFRAAAYRKQQEMRAIETQDSHYAMAQRLLKRLLEYMGSEEDFWELMTPKVAESMFKTLTAVQRVSAGLPAGAPTNEKTHGSGGQTFEMILRTLAQGGNDQGNATIDVNDGGLASRILADPNSTRLAQELIIRMSQSGSNPQ